MADKPRKRLLWHWNLIGLATRDRELSSTDIAVLWAVLQMVNSETGVTFPSLETIAERANVGNVPRAMKRLCDRQYLARQARKGRGGDKSTLYRPGALADRLVSDKPVSDGSVSDKPVCDRYGPGSTTDSDFSGSTDLSHISASKSNQLHVSVDRFFEFYAAYPRKVAKAQAIAAWNAKKLDAIADRVIADVQARVADPNQWTETKFIPHPATYLNKARWEDEWSKTHDGARRRSTGDNFQGAVYVGTPFEEIPDSLRPLQ